jgi:hypothetical protein
MKQVVKAINSYIQTRMQRNYKLFLVDTHPIKGTKVPALPKQWWSEVKCPCIKKYICVYIDPPHSLAKQNHQVSLLLYKTMIRAI